MVDIDLIMIALISEAEEEESEFISEAEKRKITRKYWVHDLWKKRHILGEFKTLCSNDLTLDPRYFYDYYKMGLDKFENLVNILKPHIQKQETNLRIPISVEERISICLR
jgi:hypothetical protein